MTMDDVCWELLVCIRFECWWGMQTVLSPTDCFRALFCPVLTLVPQWPPYRACNGCTGRRLSCCAAVACMGQLECQAVAVLASCGLCVGADAVHEIVCGHAKSLARDLVCLCLLCTEGAALNIHRAVCARDTNPLLPCWSHCTLSLPLLPSCTWCFKEAELIS